MSCDGNALDEQLIESLDSLWSEEQEAWGDFSGLEIGRSLPLEATLEAAGVTIAEIVARMASIPLRILFVP